LNSKQVKRNRRSRHEFQPDTEWSAFGPRKDIMATQPDPNPIPDPDIIDPVAPPELPRTDPTPNDPAIPSPQPDRINPGEIPQEAPPQQPDEFPASGPQPSETESFPANPSALTDGQTQRFEG
jgi:hypothetical protein